MVKVGLDYDCWWPVGMNLVVAFGILIHNFWRWAPMNGTLTFNGCRFGDEDVYHGMVGTLELYLVEKNLFELSAAPGSSDAKNWA